MEILDKEINAMHTRFSLSRSTRRTAAAGALIVLASSLLWLNAAPIKGGGGVLISPAATARANDEVRVTVSNFGQRTIRTRVLLLNALNFSPIVTGVWKDLPPRSSSFEDITFSIGLGFIGTFIAVVEFQSSGKSEVEVNTSFQLIDKHGNTQIFADGFESGSTSA